MKLHAVEPASDGLETRAAELWTNEKLASDWMRAVRWLRKESRCGWALDGFLVKKRVKDKVTLEVRIRAR